MTENQSATLFERRHVNDWIATVNATPDGFFTANARDRSGVPEAKWAAQGIADLATAQQTADDRVPTHACQCAGWLPRERVPVA